MLVEITISKRRTRLHESRDAQSKNPRSATDAQGLQRLFIGYCMLFDALKLCISKRLVEKEGSLSVLFTLELPF